jgi:hypothetical protein
VIVHNPHPTPADVYNRGFFTKVWNCLWLPGCPEEITRSYRNLLKVNKLSSIRRYFSKEYAQAEFQKLKASHNSAKIKAAATGG